MPFSVPHLTVRQRLLLVAAQLAFIAVLHILTDYERTMLHVVYRELYLVPILLAGFWFGFKGGLVTGLVVSALYLPEVSDYLIPLTDNGLANLMQVGWFILAGAGLGWLRERDLRRQDEMRRAEGLAVMGRAVSSIAHDMKNPLMAIGGFVNQVKRHMPEDDPAQRKLEIVLHQTQRLETMVTDMLAFARPLELKVVHGQLDEFLKETLELARPAAENHEVELKLAELDDLDRFHYDRDRLQQAVLNLLVNAVEASPPGGVVSMSARREQGQARITVDDQGPGLPPEMREEVLSPFVTTKKEGTGLGLPIVKKVAEAHGGKLEMGDTPQGGARISLVLPLKPPDQAMAQA